MKKQREHWGSRIGFIMAAAGSAIGLGTLWKFPYVTAEQGGGLFVLAYIVFTFLIGLPIFAAELILGRKAQRGAVGIFATLAPESRFWRVTGWMGVITAFLIMSYYSVVAGWGLNYVLLSLSQFYVGRTPEQIQQVFDVMHRSGDINILFHFLFTALTVGIVYQGIRRGIEFWSRIITTALLIMFIGLFCYATTLSGFQQAAHFIFTPNFSNFTIDAALEALGLSFFTLSVAQGIMLTYGSYMKNTENIPGTTGIVGSMVVLIALLSSMMIFPIVFTFGFPPEGGSGLVFKTLPVLFAQLPGAILISTVFFILFVFTALTTTVSLVEVVVANFIDLFEWSRRKTALIVGAAAFVVGIPSALSGTQDGLFSSWVLMYGRTFFETMNLIVDEWMLPICGLLVSLFAGWVLQRQIAYEEFLAGATMRWLLRPWHFVVRWAAPIAILLIFVAKTDFIDLDRLLLGKTKSQAVALAKPAAKE